MNPPKNPKILTHHLNEFWRRNKNSAPGEGVAESFALLSPRIFIPSCCVLGFSPVIGRQLYAWLGVEERHAFLVEQLGLEGGQAFAAGGAILAAALQLPHDLWNTRDRDTTMDAHWQADARGRENKSRN